MAEVDGTVQGNGNKDYKHFTSIIEMFVGKNMYTIKITLSDGQVSDHEAPNILRALEYVAEQAGKIFTKGVEVDEIVVRVKSKG